MNKLRINPRNNSSQKDTKLDRDKASSNVSSEGVNQDIQYFLDKNENDFTKEDLERFQRLNQDRTNLFMDDSKKIIMKLFQISKTLLKESNEPIEPIVQNNENQILLLLPHNFTALEPLIDEVIEDNKEESMEFIATLIEALVIVDNQLKCNPLNLDNLYNSLSDMLHSLEFHNVTQQKYIYRSIANTINQKITNYTFISPENGNFVDPKFHKIVSGSGQRIVRGLSYILLDSANEEVLKFGQVKTI